MKERPIIFSAPMVRALLEGRKTQTRRVIKPLEIERMEYKERATWTFNIPRFVRYCPYGGVGDRLWVREAWGFSARLPASTKDEAAWLAYSELRGYRADNPEGNWCWRSPIFMPRWASRITLEITNVRVERLFDITQEDAKAEGVSIEETRTLTHRGAFAITWDRINKKRGCGWEGGTNPFVWAISFRMVTP